MKNSNVIIYTLTLVLFFTALPSMGQSGGEGDSTQKVNLELDLSESELLVELGEHIPVDTTKFTAKELRAIKRAEKQKARSQIINGEVISADTLSMIDSLIYIDLADNRITSEGEGQIPTLEAAWKPVLTDHHIGIRGGWGTGMIRREPARESYGLPYSLWNFSVAYKFDVPEQKYVGTISFELGYMEKGYAYLLTYGGEIAYTQKYSVIELPILWQPYLPLGKGSRFHLSAGPFMSYTLSSWEKQYNITTGEVYFDREYELDPLIDYYWGFGITAGAGVVVAVDRFSFALEGRYTIQLSDILRGPEYVENAPFRSPVDNISVTIGMFYQFSIGSENQRKKTLKKLRDLNIEGL